MGSIFQLLYLRTFAALLMAASVAVPVHAVEVERVFRPIAKRDAKILRLEIPVGLVTVTPRLGNELEAELVLDCAGALAPCRQNAESLRIAARRDGETQIVGFSTAHHDGDKPSTWLAWTTRSLSIPAAGTGYPRNRPLKKGGWRLTAALNLRSPRYERVELFIGEGGVSASRLGSSAKVHVLAGTVSLEAESGSVRSVRVEIGKGSATLSLPRGGILRDKKIEWLEGEGENDLTVTIEKGNARIDLR